MTARSAAAARHASSPAVLAVLPGGRNRPGAVTVRRDAWEEQQIDRAVHDSEALALTRAALPHVRRLYLVAQECGPAAMHSVAALHGLLTGYERRHTPDDAA